MGGTVRYPFRPIPQRGGPSGPDGPTFDSLPYPNHRNLTPSWYGVLAIPVARAPRLELIHGATVRRPSSLVVRRPRSATWFSGLLLVT